MAEPRYGEDVSGPADVADRIVETYGDDDRVTEIIPTAYIEEQVDEYVENADDLDEEEYAAFLDEVKDSLLNRDLYIT